LKSSILTFSPRPTKYVQNEIKFKRTLFIRNAMRMKNICLEFVEIGQFLHSCIQWESPTRSLLAFITFIASCYKFYSALSNMAGRFLYVNGNNNTISNTDSLSNIIMGNK
ncbi:hypothetical protein BLA29_008750, partial [Euroglyphus maynei]